MYQSIFLSEELHKIIPDHCKATQSVDLAIVLSKKEISILIRI